MLWTWHRDAVNLTPDGGGISAGVTQIADCIGVSSYLQTVVPSMTATASSIGATANIAVCSILGYFDRFCNGESVAIATCDVGNGLTVLKGGSEYRNVNILEFQGSSSLSGSYSRAILNILAGGDMATPFATRIDFISDSLLYKGEAAVGSAESAAAWRISKTVIGGDGDVTTTWAGGTDAFSNTWDSHLGLSYS